MKTTYELIELLTVAMKKQNQQLINTYAYELATRLYVPDCNSTFEEILEGFGYRNLDVNPKQISIDEYMRRRNNEQSNSGRY